MATAAEPTTLAAPASASDDLELLRIEHAASRGAVRAPARTVRASANPAQRKARPVVKRTVHRTAERRAGRVKHMAHGRVHKAVSRSHTASRSSRRATWSGAASSRARSVISYAYSQLGRAYSFGNLDCSGLTMRAFARVGIRLPHKASGQDEHGYRVSRASARAGDLVFWGGDSAYHVGIYLGGGRVIHAPKPGDHVKVSPLWGSPMFVRVL